MRDDPERAAAAPEVIAHHFTEARLDDLAIEWWGKAGDMALRRSAFQEAIAHLGRAIAMADKKSDANGGTAAVRRAELQRNYGQAILWSKGFTAPETEAAFSRHDHIAGRSRGVTERHVAFQGQWTKQWARGERGP